MKKIGCLILCLFMSVMMLTACSSTYEGMFLKHNYPRDYGRVIVTIKPIKETIKRFDEEKQDTITYEYQTESVDIYKSQLVNYINTYGSTYVNSYGMSYNDMVDYLLEQLILTEIVLADAEIKFEEHKLFWTNEDIDSIQRSVYHEIDDYLFDICNEMLEKKGLPKLEESEETNQSTSTTYPVKPQDEAETKREYNSETCVFGTGKTHDDWYLNGPWFIDDESIYSLPGGYGNEETKSLAGEGIKRLVSLFEKNAEGLIRVTDEEKEQMAQDVKDLRALIDDKGVGYAYKAMGKTTLVKKLIGDSLIRSQKLTILQDYIENLETVSYEEVQRKYNKMLADQTASYTENPSAYDSAATGSDLVLYRPNNNYLYVKHILIPFSEEQTEYLKKIKANSTPEYYEAERKHLVNNIVAYEHVNGEDDTSRPLTVDQIWSEVRAAMAQASANQYTAERTFDELIYKYNTDPGAFGNETGYAINYSGNNNWMEEFTAAGIAFRDEGYKVGQIYDNYVITDYGVHIMYYAADYSAKSRLGLDGYKTPGRYTSVYKTIEKELLTAKTNAAYSNWQRTTVYYYRNDIKAVDMKTKVYKDLYQK